MALSCPIPWWQPSETSQPVADTFAEMAAEGITAIGVLLRAHPTENIYENIRKAFRNPNIDVIVLTPLHWGSTEQGCTGGKNIRWLNYPPELFEWLYQTYGRQDKTVIVQSMEDDWTVAGTGCRNRDQCVTEDGRFDFYFNACEAGTLALYDTDAETCEETACDMVKMDRAEYLLQLYDERQAAVEAARAAHPGATLRVFHSIEVNFFNDEFYLVARDLIWRMDSPPDFVGLSLYARAGDVVEAFNNVVAWTRLPSYRVYISEVGAKEGTQPDGTVLVLPHQRERIVHVIEELFALGAPIALVWSWREIPFTGGHTGYSVIDTVTGEHLSGYDAIKELNETYR